MTAKIYMETLTQSVLRPGVYGPVRVVEGWRGHERLYVKRTNLRTYALSTATCISLESMVEVGGEYHFRSLRELHAALNAHQDTVQEG